MASVTLDNVGPGSVSLDLRIRDRELVVLAGPEGCGHSTILRMIAGLAELSEGEIFLDDRRINDVPPGERDVAFMSGGYTPYPRMSVYENLAIGLGRRRFAKAEIGKRVAAVAEMLGFEKELEAGPQSLSPEQRRRLGLARAMVRQPKVYLFDEPFAGLGPDAARRGRAEITKLHQRSSTTIIYTTSDPAEAMALGERTVVINQGVVQQDADAATIFREPANLFVAGFFGDPSMNLVRGMVKQERDGFLFSEDGDGTIAIQLPVLRFAGAKDFAGKSIVLGIRPEEIEIASSAGDADRSAASFQALVSRAEPRGFETDLYLQTGAHELICRSRRWVDQAEGGRRLHLEIQPGSVHLFDPASGGRIMAKR
jgi:multiple sugar transport system ATP-binding protein